MSLVSANSAAPGAGIIADDLTGALDSGVQLAKWGLRPAVLLTETTTVDSDALVVNSDSRQVTREEAYTQARAATRRLVERSLYKKIDSTMRGNIGVEIDGVLDERDWSRALVAPAYPASGRTTTDGCHYVDGTRLAQTAFAHDPLCPMTESHLPTLLAGQTRRPVGHLPLGVIDRGVEPVIAALNDHAAQIVVADAVTQAHLHALALALVATAEPWLPCGSAGLAEEWPAALGYTRPTVRPDVWSRDGRPVLVCAGSRHPMTARQLECARDRGGLVLLNLDPNARRGQERLLAEAGAHLAFGHNVAITSVFSSYVEGQGSAVAEQLGRLVSMALDAFRVSGLVLTGGDVAWAVCGALQAEAIAIVGEVQPGVPAGMLLGGPHAGLRVVTKAGGFGDENAILHSIEYIQGRQVEDDR